MTHEEIAGAIERLKVLPEKNIYTCTDVINAICTHNWVDTLVGILQQADPDTHMEVPVDAGGVPIHIGDELCGYGYPNGGVYCMAINGADVIFVASVGMSYKDMLLWSPKDCRHYHKPTVEDVLRDFVNRVMSYNEDEDDGDAIISDYAAKLREVINSD